MRAIEFRAWDKKYKTFDNKVKLAINLDGMVFVDQDDWRKHSKDFILMQWTGLHDRNGVKIFEGDWLSLYPDEPDLFRIQEVKWNDDSASFAWNYYGPIFCSGNSNIMQVCGNIWEHPELLEPK
jgi:uncharacterized phage protein (TIGR01671 family)